MLPSHRARAWWYWGEGSCHEVRWDDLIVYILNFSVLRWYRKEPRPFITSHKRGEDQGRSWKDVQIACLQPCLWSSDTRNSAYELLCFSPIVHGAGWLSSGGRSGIKTCLFGSGDGFTITITRWSFLSCLSYACMCIAAHLLIQSPIQMKCVSWENIQIYLIYKIHDINTSNLL